MSETTIGIIIAFVVAGIAAWEKLFKSRPQSNTSPGDGNTSGSDSDSTGGGFSFNPGLYSLLDAPADVARWGSFAKHWAAEYGLPWRIIVAQVWVESTGNPDAVGSAGEKGLMQLKQIAIDDLRQNGYQVPSDWFKDGRANIQAGTKFLDLQHRRTGTIREALKAYNQGETGAKRKPVLANAYANKVINKARQIGYMG